MPGYTTGFTKASPRVYYAFTTLLVRLQYGFGTKDEKKRLPMTDHRPLITSFYKIDITPLEVGWGVGAFPESIYILYRL